MMAIASFGKSTPFCIMIAMEQDDLDSRFTIRFDQPAIAPRARLGALWPVSDAREVATTDLGKRVNDRRPPKHHR